MSKILCTICMRGGSKGVPNKNLRKLNGKPLLAYTIEQAIKANFFEHIVVSTDSEEIAKLSAFYGAETWYKRPAYLGTDQMSKIPVIKDLHAKSENYYSQTFDIIMDLDVTSPLRDVEDIINSYHLFRNEKSDNLITACPARRNPYFNIVEKVGNQVKVVKELPTSIIRRQDAPPVYDMNASIYIWKRKVLMSEQSLFSRKTSIFLMPEERSIDIDTPLDWDLVEFLIKRKS